MLIWSEHTVNNVELLWYFKYCSFYCVSRSLQYILEDYKDDDLENLDMDFGVGVSQMTYNLCNLSFLWYPTDPLSLPKALMSLPSSCLCMIDQQITWNGIEVDLDPENPEKPVTSQNKWGAWRHLLLSPLFVTLWEQWELTKTVHLSAGKAKQYTKRCYKALWS